MSVDSILALANQILAFLIIAVGIAITLYPLVQKKHKVACLSIFILMGVLVVVLSTAQSNRTSRQQAQAATEQAKLRDQIDRIQNDNRRGFDNLQARLDAVVAAVKNSPPNTNISKLSEKVTKLAQPAAPTNLTAIIQ